MTSEVNSTNRWRAIVSRMTTEFGAMLKSLRAARRMSQLQLATEAEVSTRHLSFLETGRARPSREMVLVLASMLDLPLRDRNLLLECAGFASAYRETRLEAPELRDVRQAIEIILRQHEPFPAMVLDRHWNLRMVNRGFSRAHQVMTGGTLIAPYQLVPSPAPNLMRLFFAPDGYRPFLRNWSDVVRDLLPRLMREASADPEARPLVDELMAMPGVPRLRDALVHAPVVLPVELSFGGLHARLFTTITTLGTAQDVTLQELRIEALHPADEDSRAVVTALLGSPPS